MTHDPKHPLSLKVRTGAIVQWGDFFPRPAVTDDLWERIDAGSVLLEAPRRVGKSSLLKELLNHPRRGWRCAYVDVQDAAGPGTPPEAQLVGKILEALHQIDPGAAKKIAFGNGVVGFFRNFDSIGAVKFVREIGAGWEERGAAIVTALASQRVGKDRVVVMVDELPYFLAGLQRQDPDQAEGRIRHVLDWLRRIRMAHLNLHWVFAGSIGLDAFCARLGLTGTLNDLSPFRLPPLKREELESLVAALELGQGLGLELEARHLFMETLGDWPIPFFVQLLFQHSMEQCEMRDVLRREHVAQGRTSMLTRRNSSMAHWEQRLQETFDQEAHSWVHLILAQAAKADQGLSLQAVQNLGIAHGLAGDLNAILQTLEHDGYLVRDGDRYRFQSSLLREWWRRHVAVEG